MVPITDAAVMAKIHQTYRIQYIKDVILPRYEGGESEAGGGRGVQENAGYCILDGRGTAEIREGREGRGGVQSRCEGGGGEG